MYLLVQDVFGRCGKQRAIPKPDATWEENLQLGHPTTIRQAKRVAELSQPKR